MCRPTPNPLRRRRGEDGFTLIEVLVALAVLSIIAVSAVPLLASAGRAARSARFATQAKNLGQERIERMRNLPYYVDAVNGTGERDLFDTYYPRLTPAATGTTVATATTGYVSATSAARVPGEPDAGAYYRVVSTVSGHSDFRQIVATQFISAIGTAVTPLATYNTTPTLPAQTGFDSPASGIVGVTVLTSYVKNGAHRPTRFYTRIVEGRPASQIIVSQARSTAVSVISAASTSAGGGVISLSGGVVNVDGSRSIDATTSLIAQGALAVRNTTKIEGATKLMSAPADRTESTLPVSGKSVDALTCLHACFGETEVANTRVAVANGLPKAGVGTNSVEATVRRPSNGFDFQYNNASGSTDSALQVLSGPLIHLPDGTSGTAPLAKATGFVDATAGAGTTSTTSGASASTQLIKLFPTTFAPNGVVQVRLELADLGCSVSRSGSVVTRTPSANFRATVRYMTLETSGDDPADLASGYSAPVVIEDGMASDPLATINLSTTKVSPTKYLIDYLRSWAGLTGATSTNLLTDTTRGLRASLDGIVSITTAPTRGTNDPLSVINLKVGSLSCYAEDNR